jgi:hypothetical protein
VDRAEPTVQTSEEPPPELSKRTIVASVVKRGGPRLLEASFIPSALFYTALSFGSIGVAYVVAIGWTYGCLGRRLWRGAQVTGVLVLSSVGITIRTALAVGSGSTFIYFAQPIIGTVVTAGVFLVSIVLGRPLIAKLAHDFWPITEEQAEIPRVRRLMVGLTVLWAGVNLATASMTLILLLSLDLTTFLAAKQITGLAITVTAIAITITWAHRTASAEGIIAPSRRGQARLIDVSRTIDPVVTGLPAAA